MWFQMTQADIDTGTPCSVYACPVYRTITRTLNTERVAVRKEFIFINGVHYRVPGNVAAFIDLVDDGQQVKPIRFWLPVEVQP